MTDKRLRELVAVACFAAVFSMAGGALVTTVVLTTRGDVTDNRTDISKAAGKATTALKVNEKTKDVADRANQRSISNTRYLQGRQGRPGLSGGVGPAGRRGLRGAQGPRGEQGPRGTAGGAVVGPVGPRGVQGEMGPQGPPGIPGESGAQGEMGVPGVPGQPGPVLPCAILDPSLGYQCVTITPPVP